VVFIIPLPIIYRDIIVAIIAKNRRAKAVFLAFIIKNMNGRGIDAGARRTYVLLRPSSIKMPDKTARIKMIAASTPRKT
jgi:hypothetical protein